MTFDEARLMANVNARSERLFEDGYRARWLGTYLLEIRNRAGAAYRIDTLSETCDCPFFRGHGGRHPCKHVLGRKRLLARQRACRRLVTLMLLLAWADLDDGAPRACGAEQVPAEESSAGRTEAAHTDA